MSAADNTPSSSSPSSPRITHITWGRMDIEGLGTGKDFKLYPGGGRSWDWNETGTRHRPGIQPSDVYELVDKGSKVVVLSRGMHLRLQTCLETLDFLKKEDIQVHVAETTKAVEIYNRLVDSKKSVGGLFHSTC